MTLDITQFCWYLERPWPARLRILIHCAPRHALALVRALNLELEENAVRAKGRTLICDSPVAVARLVEMLGGGPDLQAVVRLWALEVGKGKKGRKLSEAEVADRRRLAESAWSLQARSTLTQI